MIANGPRLMEGDIVCFLARQNRKYTIYCLEKGEESCCIFIQNTPFKTRPDCNMRQPSFDTFLKAPVESMFDNLVCAEFISLDFIEVS